MPATTLTPADLDQAAARLAPAPLRPAEVEAWRGITADYQRTAPASPAARQLLTKTVAELVAEAESNLRPDHGTRPAVEIRMPGRLGRAVPDWAHRSRADLSHPPSMQLLVAAKILQEWGWQAKPHHLRDCRGRRCLCGAICAAVGLGVGSDHAAELAAGHVLGVLREQHRWPHLIGDWAQVPGRTAGQVIDVVHAAHNRALASGQ